MRQRKVRATIQTVQEARLIIALQGREAELYEQAHNENDQIHAIEQAVENQRLGEEADWQEVSIDVLNFEEVHDEFAGVLDNDDADEV